MSRIRYATSTNQQPRGQEPCSCPPLDVFPPTIGADDCIPVAPALQETLQAGLASHFPRETPFSLLLLHITQVEHIQMPPGSSIVHKRLNCHASASFLEQVIHTVRRTLRASDRIVTDARGSGAAFLFPEVDQVGMSRIAERVSRGINLLQSETVIPPLLSETEVALGFGSYPEPGSTLAELLAHAGRVQTKIIFRPAVLSESASQQAASGEEADQNPREPLTDRVQGIPFMRIPRRLPAHLKRLVPHTLALELRCAPVGRDHNCLTVAMANPADMQTIYRLREVTGMMIFPVSCDIAALETLLASNW